MFGDDPDDYGGTRQGYINYRLENEINYNVALKRVKRMPEPTGQKYKRGEIMELTSEWYLNRGEKYCVIDYTHGHAFPNFGFKDGSIHYNTKDYSVFIRGKQGWYALAWVEETSMKIVTDKDKRAELWKEFKETKYMERL